jgi:hypothetical protein
MKMADIRYTAEIRTLYPNRASRSKDKWISDVVSGINCTLNSCAWCNSLKKFVIATNVSLCGLHCPSVTYVSVVAFHTTSVRVYLDHLQSRFTVMWLGLPTINLTEKLAGIEGSGEAAVSLPQKFLEL